MPFVSVIIPNYNHGAFLKERIDSVLNQTFTDYEVIILDDASTDNSKEIIEEYSLNPKITHIIYNNNNSGSPFKQWAKGIALAKADWIWMAESDDSCSVEFLSKMVPLVQGNKQISIVYSDANYMNEERTFNVERRFSLSKNKNFVNSKWSNNYVKNGQQELEENLAYVCTINNTSAALLKKNNLIENIEAISHFSYHGDWYAYILSTLKGNIAYNASALCNVRMHKKSHLNTKKDSVKRKEEYFRILNLLIQCNQINRKYLNKFFALQYLNFSFLQTIAVPPKYLAINFGLGLKVLWYIFLIKLKGLKPKIYFD